MACQSCEIGCVHVSGGFSQSQSHIFSIVILCVVLIITCISENNITFRIKGQCVVYEAFQV